MHSYQPLTDSKDQPNIKKLIESIKINHALPETNLFTCRLYITFNNYIQDINKKISNKESLQNHFKCVRNSLADEFEPAIVTPFEETVTCFFIDNPTSNYNKQITQDEKYNLIKENKNVKNLYKNESDLQNPLNLAVRQFESVYEAAKSLDHTVIRLLLDDKVSIDVHKGRQTPAQVLAQTNEIAAVNFLIKEFRADINEAVLGAEKGGIRCRELANNFIKRGASINFAIRGAAEGGDIGRAKELLRLGANPSYALWGEGAGGFIWQEKHFGNTRKYGYLDKALSDKTGEHCHFVIELLQKKAKIKYFFRGVGEGNHGKLLKYLIRQDLYRNANLYFSGESSEASRKCNLNALIGISEAGNIELYNYMRGFVPDRDSGSGYDTKDIVLAAAKSGDLIFAREVGAHFGNLDVVPDGAIMGGHRDFLQETHWGSPQIFKSGQFRLLNEILNDDYNFFWDLGAFKSGLSETEYFNNDLIALRSLCSIGHDYLRKKFAEGAKKMHLLPRANDICQLNLKYNLNFEQGLTWTTPGIQSLLAFVMTYDNLILDIWFLVFSYIPKDISLLITIAETRDLIQKMSFVIKKKELINNLQKDYDLSGTIIHDKRFIQLKLTCEQAKQNHELFLALNNAKKLIKQRDHYSECIDHYLEGFSVKVEEITHSDNILNTSRYLSGTSAPSTLFNPQRNLTSDDKRREVKRAELMRTSSKWSKN